MARKTVANLNIRIGADTGQLQQGFRESQKQVRTFTQGAKQATGGLAAMASKFALVLAAVYAAKKAFDALVRSMRQLYQGVRQSIRELDKLINTTEKLGLTFAELQTFRLAGGDVGIDPRTVDMGLQRLIRRISEAAIGAGEAQNALEEELGVDAQALNAAGGAEAMFELADAFADIGNEADKARLAQKLFDSEGVDLVRILNLGSEALREMQRELERMGLLLSQDQEQNVAEAENAYGRLGAAIEGAFAQLSAALSPAIQSALVDLTEIVIGITTVIRENQTNIRMFAEDLAEVAFYLRQVANSWGFFSREIEEAGSKAADAGRRMLQAQEEMAQAQKLAEARAREAERRFEEEGKALADELERIAREAESLEDSLRTPFEEFEDYIRDVKRLLDVGAIDLATFSRAEAKAIEDLMSEFKDELKVEMPKDLGAQVRGTAGERASRFRSQKYQENLERSAKRREDLLKRIEVHLGDISRETETEPLIEIL